MKHRFNHFQGLKLISFQNKNFFYVKFNFSLFRENTNKVADERELEQELEDELQEMRQQYEDDYIQKLNEYKQKIERWKQQKIEKVI